MAERALPLRLVQPDRTSPAPSATRPVGFRGGGFVVIPYRGAPLAFFILVLAIWEAAVRMDWLSPLFLPAPSTIIAALWDLTSSGLLWQHLGISLLRIFGGWALGTLFGIVAGLMIGIWSLSRAVGLSLISALFPIPKIALLPLFILWLGIGETSKVAIIALGVFFPTAISVYTGIDGVPRNLIRMAQSFGLPASAVLWKVVLPGAVPNILAGFRITASLALILLVSAEMIGAQYGIGAFVLQTGNMMLTDQLLAGVVVLSILGLLISAVLTRVEKRALRWR